MALVLAASCFVARPAGAQAVDDATRAAARSLGYEGVQDFQAGSYPAAADKLDRAYRALRVPSLGLWSARALEKVGKLVEASERLLEVQRLDPSGGDVNVQKQAQADAAADQAAIAPRIPSIVILIEGATADQARVTVNGSPVPASLIGLKRQVNPGSVKIDGVSGGATATESVTLKEGESKSVTLRFAAGAAAVAPAAAGATSAPGQQPAPTPVDEPSKPGSGRRTVGFIVLGAGGVGIAVGAITGGLAMAKKSSIDGCEGNRCPISAKDDVDSYNGMRMVSSIGFIAGGALAATGIVLIVTEPKASESTASASSTYRLAPWVGERGAGIVLGVER